MDDFDLTRSKVVTVVPQMARQLRMDCHFDRQRKLDQYNIDRLANAMRRGTFIPGTQIYFGVLPDNKHLILNGNHTLEAVVSSESSQELTFTYHPVKTIDAAALIYACFDNQRKRSWADRMIAINAKQFVKHPLKIGPALSFIEDGFIKLKGMADTAERASLIEQHALDANIVESCLFGAPIYNRRLLQRTPVLAVALYTAKYQPDSAISFWTSAAHEDQPLKHPTRTLIKYLHNIKCVDSTYREILFATSLAWNAAYEGRQLEVCRPNNCKELRILGTPWHKGDPR